MHEHPMNTRASDPEQAPLHRNVVSHLGFLAMIGSAILIAFAMLSQLTIQQPSPYVGIFTYLVFPSIFAVGVLIVLYGMRWEAKRRRRTGALNALPYPRLDLNDATQRRHFGYVLVGSSVLGTILVWALYNGYLYTESVQFCGALCHVPMKPEYTAYQYSAHARVPCVDCHVGPGASWYARSKLSGVRQVFAVLFNTFDRPIPSPILHLRPARETCEQCHWPRKFYGATLVQLPRFRYSAASSAEQISLTVKTGGGSEVRGPSAGIHWHMLIGNTVSFVARTEKKQDIPWVRVEHSDGTVTEFFRGPADRIREEMKAMPQHVVDCIDCHNRPTHDFPTPDTAVDEGMFRGTIPRSLPWIKKVAVEALVAPYAGQIQAHQEIEAALVRFFRSRYPRVFKAQRKDIDRAVRSTVSIFDRSVFPEMNVTWGTYPSNVGHRDWPGCFRCHDGRHVSPEGRVLTHQCDGPCHTMPRRGPTTALGVRSEKADRHWHPWEEAQGVQIGAHDKVLCHECHRAGRGPLTSCGDCHD